MIVLTLLGTVATFSDDNGGRVNGSNGVADRTGGDANNGALGLARTLSRRLPAFRGKNTLVKGVLLKMARQFPSDITITARDGLQFIHCDLKELIYRILFVDGVWEPDLTWMYDWILSPGDIVLDIGACFGYHALRAALKVGARGHVYAFEPQPDVFSSLQGNVAANHLPNVTTNCLALGAEDGILELHRFEGLPMGNTSVSTLNRTDYKVLQCPVQRLDRYLATQGLREVTLMKLDAEGAELSVLKGAAALLGSPKPPMVVLEINYETAESCGYRPDDLLALLASYGYSFYRPVQGQLMRKFCRIEKCQTGQHGENLLCVEERVHSHRLQRALRPARGRK